MAKELPRISVVVPFYRDAVYIEDCLRSVQQQADVDVEIIAVDDGGDDGSEQIVRDAMRNDPRVRLVRHDRNRGLAASRNTGIAHARGDLVTFLDADDFLFPGSLEVRARRLVYMSRWNREVAGCYCGWEMVPEDTPLNYAPTAEPKSRRLRYLSCAGDNPLIATAPVLWRSIVTEIGGFDESFPTAEDFEFWTRLLRQGYELVPCGVVGVAYRQKQTSMIADGLVEHAQQAARVLAYIDRSLEPSEVSAKAPAPFRFSIAQHQRNSTWLRRLTVFVVIAEATGADEKVSELLSMLPDTVRVTDLDVETGLDKAIDAGIARYELQHAPVGPVERADLARRVRDRLVFAIADRHSDPDVHRDLQPMDVDAVAARGAEHRL